MSPLTVDMDHVTHHRVDLVGPAAAAEDAVMADAGLHPMGLHERAQPAAQFLRRQGLADRADIVPLALYRQQRGPGDCPRRGPTTMPKQAAPPQAGAAKD